MSALSPALPALRPTPRVRGRFLLAIALSLLLHLTVFVVVRPPPPRLLRPGATGPMVVELNAPPAEAAAPAPLPEPTPRAEPQAPVHPRAPVHVPRAPPRVAPPPPMTTPAPAARSVPVPPPAPQVDMMAEMRARRAQREAQEAAAERPDSAGPSGAGHDTGLAALNRNLGTLAGDDGVGGIFQILWKGTLSAEYAFNGWQPDSRRRWRQVIDVRADPADGDIDRAIVRSMITLIRSHYSGDFLWESRRLGRIVTLSARAENNAELEDFLLREFFGTPTLKPGSR